MLQPPPVLRGIALIISLLLLASIGHAQSPPTGSSSPGDASSQPAAAEAQNPAAERVDLAELTRLAIRGPRAEMARQDTRRAEARVDEVGAVKYPKLTLNAHAEPSPDITCIGDDCARTDPGDGLTGFSGIAGGAKLEARQALYGFGRSGPILGAVRAAAQATAFLEDAVAGDLALEAARAYYGLKLARELTLMLEDGLIEIAKALANIDEHIEDGSGEATLQDRLRVATLQAEIQARLSEARQAEAIALAGARALAGNDSLDIDQEPLAPVELQLSPVADYVAQANAARAEIKAARAGAEAAHAKRKFESAQYLPVLFLFAEYELNRATGVDEPPTLFARDRYNHHFFRAGIALRWEIDWFAQRAKVAGARAQAHQADALVELAQAVAGFDARRAYAEASQAKARMDAAQKGEKTARTWVASVLQARIIGAVESKDLADALIAYFTLRSRYVTSVYEWNLATTRLRRAAGQTLTRPQ